MSNRKPPFHFEDGNPIDREKIWKRFGFNHNTEEDRRMFYEPSPAWQSKFHRPPQFDDPEWRNRSVFNEPGASSPSFGRRMRMGPNWSPEDEIPIRVVHEKTPPMDDGNDSETSSQASHGSQGSSASGNGHPMKAKITREPRVHHIPIMVEPRDGSTSSGYASDGGGANHANQQPINKPPPAGVNLSKQNSVDSNMDTEDYPVPNVHQLKKNFEHGQPPERRRESSVRTIPIKVLRDDDLPSDSNVSPRRSSSANSFGTTTPLPASPRQRKASSHPPMASPSSSSSAPRPSPNGPHVTKIPVNIQQQKREISPEASAEKETHSRVKSTPNPLDEIKNVLDGLSAYKKQIEEFSGKPQDKAYRYLDEMLTRLMLKLDNVETNGQDNIRQARKAAVREIESWISLLETKAASSAAIHNSSSNVPLEAEMEQENNSQKKEEPEDGQQSRISEENEQQMTLDPKNPSLDDIPASEESMETDTQKISNPENEKGSDSKSTFENPTRECSATAQSSDEQ